MLAEKATAAQIQQRRLRLIGMCTALQYTIIAGCLDDGDDGLSAENPSSARRIKTAG
jgi:predicted kinase